jgi:predicted ATPase/signal transduction histidine kinase
MISIPNYQITNKIYQSAHSLVYRGVRDEDNQPVILKILKEDYPTPTKLTHYRQEYEIIRNLTIDGVIKTSGLEKYQNTLIIILEDFGGESLKNLMAISPFETEGNLANSEDFGGESLKAISPFKKGTIRPISFLPLAIQLAEILGKIHAANVIHKDINPSNLVLNPNTGQLKIIDFGISTVLPRENPTFKNPNQLEGTLAYLSPEQTGRINRSVDYRTDLYSLGGTFYELLSGRVPFDSTDSLELIHCHIAKTPVPVCEIKTDVPLILSDIVMKLMAKNVEDRYQSAFGLKWDLEKCLAHLKDDQSLGSLNKNRQSLGGLKSLNFKLAQNDFSGRFQIPQKLYGRENDVKTLLQAFERVTGQIGNGTETKELMLVAGYSGVGKTALVNEIHKPITATRGYFIAGKYDQYQRNIPYSALTQAFNKFCQDLVSESEEQLAIWKKQILNAIGPNGQVLIEVIPNLQWVIGPQPEVAQLGAVESQNRFLWLFQNFVKAISQPEHPLVIFIDDWQWADSASLNLLKIVMTDPDIQPLLIIGAYRANQVDATHPFIMTLETLRKQQTIINTVTLDNLSYQDVNALIAETLQCDKGAAQPLTELVYEKTHGNAFFTTAFLKALYDEALLVFDFKTQKWQWAVDKIRQKGMTNNVVELMVATIQNCPANTQAVLKLAASVGNPFDLQTLSIIYKQTPKQTLEALWQAITVGLITPLDDNYKLVESVDQTTPPVGQSRFKFQHDRIQQAAYALIAEAEKSAIHLEIGRLLLANTNLPQALQQEESQGSLEKHQGQLDEHLFDIVNQLNGGHTLITNEVEKATLARLNWQAGKKAKDSTAYQSATNYLALGIQLLGETAWNAHYEIAFELYQEQGECEFLRGNFERSEQLLAIALEKAQSKFEKAKVYLIKITQLSGQGKYLQALATMIEALNLLGMNVPLLDDSYAKATAVEIALSQTRQIEELWHLPLMQNQEMKLCTQIIAIATDSIIIGCPEMLAFYSAKMVNISIQYGLSTFIPTGYAAFAIVMSAGKDYTRAYQFAALALQLNQEKLINQTEKSKIYNAYSFLSILRKHTNVTAEHFRETYRLALETGNFTYAGYGITELPRYIIPTSLKEGLQATQEAISYCQKANNIPMLFLAQLFEGFINNLQGNSLNKTSFNTNHFTEATFINRFEKAAPVLLALYKRYKIQALTLFECYEQALPLVHERTSWIEAFGAADLSFRNDYYLYAGITVAALYPKANEAAKATYLEILSECMTENQLLNDQCQANFGHPYLILQAEQARLENRTIEAMAFYDKAIASAKQNSYLCHEALASELAAKFWLTHQKQNFAFSYLKEAHYAYGLWGATAKVKDLEEKYPQLLTPSSAATGITSILSTITDTTTVSQSSALDFASLLKASQALASEIELKPLLTKLMTSVIENAGAQQGFLVIKKNGQWVIEAEGAIEKTAEVSKSSALYRGPSTTPFDRPSVKVKTAEVSKTSEISGRLPTTLINYVLHSQEHVVLNNAANKNPFSQDSYLKTQQPKSVLCTPLRHQGQLTALLYLENNLITGAFTPERLEVLKMLSAQAAISIENANLYNQLEKKVAERTQELSKTLDNLKATQAQLIESEKMASLGNLVAGVAHEINTPLGTGITAASTLIAKTETTANAYDNKQLKASALKAYFDRTLRGSRLILNNLERASELVQSFKQVAVDQTNLEKRTFAVKNTIEDTLINLKPRLKRTQHQITVNGDDDIQIESYPGAFSQIITNLVINSLNYAYPNGADGHLRFNWHQKEQRLILEYSDDGCGIPADNLGKIFEPFFTTGRGKGGTGLGLHIVYNLTTQKLQGTIHCDSKIGVGTTFTLNLPVKIK